MIEYLTFEQLIEIHDAMIERFGGLRGIRDKNLLHSVVEMPKTTMFNQDLYPSLHEKASIYLLSIVRNHPFNDGNKRTGAVAAYLFFQSNDKSPKFTDEHYENLILEVARGEIEKEEVVLFFTKGCK